MTIMDELVRFVGTRTRITRVLRKCGTYMGTFPRTIDKVDLPVLGVIVLFVTKRRRLADDQCWLFYRHENFKLMENLKVSNTVAVVVSWTKL